MDDLEIKVHVTSIDSKTGRAHVKISETDFNRIFEHSVQLDGLKIRFFLYLLENKVNSSHDGEVMPDFWFSLNCQDEMGLLDTLRQLNFADLQIVFGPKKGFLATIEANGAQQIFVNENDIDLILETSKEFEYGISFFFMMLEMAVNNGLYEHGQRARFSLRGLDKLQLRETIKRIRFANFEIISE